MRVPLSALGSKRCDLPLPLHCGRNHPSGMQESRIFVAIPLAMGLMAPLAATASEFNIAGVNQYGSEEQVTSITQFSDVQPTDWAYQALSNLI